VHCLDKALSRAVIAQQLFDLAAQYFVACASQSRKAARASGSRSSAAW
jgi:hypothetical protein